VIAPYKTLKVSAGANFSIQSSHLFCCSATQMWQGISLATSGGTTGTLSISKGSMIEDAVVAVDITNASTTMTGTIFSSDQTVFNRNTVGININNFPSSASGYPFTITGNTFTCRDFTNYYSGGAFPYYWPTAATLNGAYVPAYPVNPPVYIDKSTAMPTTGLPGPYPRLGIECKNGQDAFAGIKLLNASPTSLTTYPGVLIGIAGSPTLFDNLDFGVNDTNSNATVVASCFSYIHQATVSPSYGIGIYAYNTKPSVYLLQLNVNQSAFLANNQCRFYNNRVGMYSYEFGSVNCYYNSAYSTHINTAYDATNGAQGFYVYSSYVTGINMNSDTAINIDQGIVYASANDNYTGSGGIVNMNNNTITGQPVYWLNGYCDWAITANNTASTAGGTRSGYIYTSNNQINSVYCGILVNNYKCRYGYSMANNIAVCVMPGGFAGSTTGGAQWGILHSNDARDNIVNNYMTSYSGGTINSAVGAQNNVSDTVTCNEALTWS